MNEIPMIKVKRIEATEGEKFGACQADVALTALSAIGDMVCHTTGKAIDVVRNSSKSEWREKYQILHDYSKERDTLSCCNSLQKAVTTYTKRLSDLVDAVSRASTLMKSIRGEGSDGGEDFVNRMDISWDVFSDDYKKIRQAIISLLKPYRPSDHNAIYPLFFALYLSTRAEAMNLYSRMYVLGFSSNSSMSFVGRVKTDDLLCTLIRRCNFHDKDGHPFEWRFNREETEKKNREHQKKSWMLKNESNPPVCVDVYELFKEDSLFRASWEMETHMMNLETVDAIISKAEGKDPEYRKDYPNIKRIQSCSSYYEQAILNSAIVQQRFKDIPRLMRRYLDFVPCLHKGKKSIPVVGYRMINKNGKPEFVFAGIWNSCSEAARECAEKWQIIHRCVTTDNKHDGQGMIWLTLYEYLPMLYDLIREFNIESAKTFFELMKPELQEEYKLHKEYKYKIA